MKRTAGLWLLIGLIGYALLPWYLVGDPGFWRFGWLADPLHLLGADDGGAGGRGDVGVAAGVIGVPVGVEDQGQFPAELFQFGQDHLGVGRVDTGGQAGGVVADQEAVIVGKARKLVDGDRHEYLLA